MKVVRFTQEHVSYIPAVRTLFAKEAIKLARHYNPGLIDLQIATRDEDYYRGFLSEWSRRDLYLALREDGSLQGLLETFKLEQEGVIMGSAAWTLVEDKRVGAGRALHEVYRDDCQGNVDAIVGAVAFDNIGSLEFCRSIGYTFLGRMQDSYILGIPLSERGREIMSGT
tara:strand:- start:3945 stop:4451 length:507 start_codon:yes stop_codon:yes gene_type:complete